MKPIALCVALCLAAFCALPAIAQDSSSGTDQGQSSGSDQSENDMFNAPESTTQTTQQTQNAAPREDLLKESVPRITGTFTSSVSASWNWSNIWNANFDPLNPTSHSLNEEDTGAALGFVARPDTDISVTAEIRTNYPFVQQITTGSGLTASTYIVPDITVWSLYSKFTWNDTLFFTFGQQPLKWGTGYFFSPADDVFAQSNVDLSNPTAERQGPLAFKVQYPIPHTQDNLYFFAALPSSTNPATLASVKPEDIAVAAKAEFLFGNTEVGAAGYYQHQQRPEAILMATTGTGDFNFFGEGLVAFPGSQPDPYIETASTPVTWATGTSAYTITDRSADVLFSGTGGAMYMNSDWNLTVVAQYLYNGMGYDSITVKDILQATMDRARGQPAGEPALNSGSLLNYFTGLGKVGKHYGVLYASWTSIFDSKTDLSLLALANLSDGSGYVSPTVTFTAFTHMKLSAGVSFSWGGTGTEFADPTGFSSEFPTLNGQTNPNYNPNYVAEPTMAVTLGASFGTVSF